MDKMAVIQRKKKIINDARISISSSPMENKPNTINVCDTTRGCISWFMKICFVCLLGGVYNWNSNHPKEEDHDSNILNINLQLMKNNHNDVLLGPHSISIQILHDNNCNATRTPPIIIQISGDALLNVPLIETSPQTWSGSFVLPIEGIYDVEYHVYNCHNDTWSSNVNRESHFHAIGNPDKKDLDDHSLEEVSQKSLFVKGAWITKKRVKIKNHQTTKEPNNNDNRQSIPYLWANPDLVKEGKEHTPLSNSDGSVIVLKEAVWTSKEEAYSFTDLGNYELVCWVGSQSAHSIIEAFKSLRPKLFPHQRPFKFHYYNMTNDFLMPDVIWSTDQKTKFRKCKQIFISMDEIMNLSQLEYMNQVQTFIQHLLLAFNDHKTFPAKIWMLTVNDSIHGRKYNTKYNNHDDKCHTPHLKMESSLHHPCNDALQELFRREDMFPPDRVQLFDNTDIISAPIDMISYKDAFAVIAMRIYVIVGKQVQTWRNAGIRGTQNGLQTPTGLKPNFKLEAYDWT